MLFNCCYFYRVLVNILNMLISEASIFYRIFLKHQNKQTGFKIDVSVSLYFS